MKANEIPKSRFVYPNKLYARTNDNITLDISYAPQTLEAVEYTRTDIFIDKAVEYFHRGLEDTKVMDDYRNILVPGIQARYMSVEEFIEDFRNYMEVE